MTKLENITLVTVCDNHYAIMLAALIKSLDLNHRSEEHIDLHIVSDHISRSSQKKLEQCVRKERITVIWHDIQQVIPKDTKLPLDKTSYPLNMYARLFIPYFLPESVGKAIYVDVDMIVEQDISLLWHTDIAGKVVAGVVDQLKIIGGAEWTAIPNYKELGFDPNIKYFNSGLIVMDLNKWRKTDVTARIFECIEQNKAHVRFPDQYGLNVVFIDQWHELDEKWNAYANQDLAAPGIIHFIMTKPIYETYNLNEKYKAAFYKYLNLTPWKGFKPMSKFRNYLQKGKHKLKKKLLGLFR